MDPATDTPQEPPLALTDNAVEKVKGFRAGVPDGEEQAMWVEITGIARGEYVYNMSLKPLSAAAPGDSVQEHDGLKVVVPAADVDKVRGATVDWSDDLMRGGLMLINPNSPSPAVGAAAPAGDLTGDVAQRVAQVIDRQINPAIAAHGGRAELVGVEDDVAYVRLGGGCQGCGMATVTLGQGIEVAIVDNVPEIDQVVDVTDHAAGDNPYFEAAKK